jgi:sugar O-acyltransferase (sialic acid O-acetyltransferase NeuD family)
MRTPLLLVAASGLAREVAEAVAIGSTHQVVAILDDNPALHGRTMHGIPIVGPVEAAAGRPDTEIAICAGSGSARLAIVERLAAVGVGPQRFATVVHPRASVGRSSRIGAGTLLLANAVLTADVLVGRHVVLMPGVVLTHDAKVDDFATLCAGVALGGNVRIGRSAYLGMNSSVRQRLHVGAGAVLGMGSVLLKDLPPGETWVGAPAHPARSLAGVS